MPLPLSPLLCARGQIPKSSHKFPALIPLFIVCASSGQGCMVGCGFLVSRASSQGCCALFQVGIQVSYEDLCSGKHCSICKAYATFVAQGPLGSKVSSGWWWGDSVACLKQRQ